MSTKVKSDGKVQVALLAAAKDPKVSLPKFEEFANKKNLNQCNKKYLIGIKGAILARSGGKNSKVIGLLDKFIEIREKQSPNRLADYSVLTR